jgi:hypothetical protein
MVEWLIELIGKRLKVKGERRTARKAGKLESSWQKAESISIGQRA